MHESRSTSEINGEMLSNPCNKILFEFDKVEEFCLSFRILWPSKPLCCGCYACYLQNKVRAS